MQDGFLRVAAATPEIRVADCSYNAEQIRQEFEKAPADTALLVFPELCLTGYTCGDLFLQPTLLQAAEQALADLLGRTADCDTLLLIGLPVAARCLPIQLRRRLPARAVCSGLLPKTNLPNYAEYYEARHFAPDDGTVRPFRFAGQSTLLGARQLFSCRTMPSFCLGVELCEDMWVAEPPSGALAKAGATVIANLSASDESIGKAVYRRDLVLSQSARLTAAYVYASAGEGESTTDLVFGGHRLIAENGVLLAGGTALHHRDYLQRGGSGAAAVRPPPPYHLPQ